MFKIVLTGPESTGKSTLAGELAAYFDTLWVPEFARSYLDQLGRSYRQSDLLDIAKGQVREEDDFSKKAEELLFIDTSLEVIKVWSEFRYGGCDPWILKNWKNRRHELYLLCAPDMPWTFDPQRENPNDRDVLFEIYRKDLTALGAHFFEIKGIGGARFQNALDAVAGFLKDAKEIK